MCGFGAGYKRLEPRGVVNGNICQNFPIQFDARPFQSADKFAVRDFRYAARGVDAHNPQRAEIALLQPPPYVSVTKRFLDGFLRGTVQLGFCKKETLGAAQGFMAVIPPSGTSFDSWHVCSLNLYSGGSAGTCGALLPLLRNWFNRLIRQHGAQLRLVGLVGDDRMAKFAFTGTRLGRQDVAGGGVVANHFAGSGFLEAFRRTLMGLHLGHILSWEFVRMAMKSPVRNYFPECNTPWGY